MTAKFLVKIFGKKGLGRVEGMQSVFSSLGVITLGGNGQVLVCSRVLLLLSEPAVTGLEQVMAAWRWPEVRC